MVKPLYAGIAMGNVMAIVAHKMAGTLVLPWMGVFISSLAMCLLWAVLGFIAIRARGLDNA